MLEEGKALHIPPLAVRHEEDRLEAVLHGVAELEGEFGDVLFVKTRELVPQYGLDLSDGLVVAGKGIVIYAPDAKHSWCLLSSMTVTRRIVKKGSGLPLTLVDDVLYFFYLVFNFSVLFLSFKTLLLLKFASCIVFHGS